MYPTGPFAPLRRFLAGLTEYTFEARLGVADPPLVDYLSGLITGFIRSDNLYRLRSVSGEPIAEVAEMLQEAEARVGEARREAHRHIGDFTLFWTGIYPEALKALRKPPRKDHLIDYMRQGKLSYRIASTLPNQDETQMAVLERLSQEYEMCAFGLNEVRREWERREGDEKSGPPILFE